MNLNDTFKSDYLSINTSRSGRISKNRFRYEYLWGLSKIYELYIENKDFIVIFDNKCDIDVFF